LDKEKVRQGIHILPYERFGGLLRTILAARKLATAPRNSPAYVSAIDSLQAFEAKLRDHNTETAVIEYHVEPALHAICELQAFVTGNRTEIPSRKAARIYIDFLDGRIEQLRKMELALDT
jgi:hypothetical protein